MPRFIKTGNCFDCSLKLNLFCYMTDEQLAKVDNNRHEVVFKPGETIFKSGGPLTHMICITKGLVKVYLETPLTNKRILLALVKPVQLIGGPGFLVDDMHYITVEALEETQACYVKVKDYKEVMRTNPEFSMELVRYLNERTITHYTKIINFAHKQTHGKVADTLLYLAGEIYNTDSFATPLTRQDLADMCAMAKESVIRVLKEFVDEGIINCGIRDFEILDKKKLLKISQTG